MKVIIFILAVLVSHIQGADIPGGQVLTSEALPANTYQLLLSPGVRIEPGGAYLSSRLRYQVNQDVGLGIRFGAGEAGFHFGTEGLFHLYPPSKYEPALALLVGMYMNRLTPENYFSLRAMPIVSQSYVVSFGNLTPYTGTQLSPAFSLGGASNQFSIKQAVGLETLISSMDGLRVWTEFDLGILNSSHEVIIGVSYPFVAL